MSVRSVPALFAALLLLAAVPCPAGQPLIQIAGGGERFSLDAREASLELLRSEIRAKTGHAIVAPETAGARPVTVAFDELVARDAVARLGGALGGLEPLHVSWQEDGPAPEGRARSEYYLVRPGARRRQLIDACGLAAPGVAQRHLLGLLRAEGAAAVPDAAAHAVDPSRSDRERVTSIKLLGTLGSPQATPPLVALLRGEARALPREAAAVALGLSGSREAFPALRLALTDPEPLVALSAAWSLARNGDTSGVPLALATLQSARGGAALRALEVITATGDARHLPALEAALAVLGDFERVRTRMAIADLGMAGLDEAGQVAACERLLADPDFEIRRHGAARLARSGTTAARAALERVAADRTLAGAREAADAAAFLRRSTAPPPRVVVD